MGTKGARLLLHTGDIQHDLQPCIPVAPPWGWFCDVLGDRPPVSIRVSACEDFEGRAILVSLLQLFIMNGTTLPSSVTTPISFPYFPCKQRLPPRQLLRHVPLPGPRSCELSSAHRRPVLLCASPLGVGRLSPPGQEAGSRHLGQGTFVGSQPI